MNKSRICLLTLVLIGSLFMNSARAQQNPLAFTGARILPIGKPAINNGVLIIQQGKIIAVGDSTTRIPAQATVFSVKGKTIMPGFVDTHSHLGGPEGGDNSSALSPEARALDAINPTSDGFKKALAGGITTVNVMPGSGLLMSGQTVYLKMRVGNTIEDLLITNEKGVYGGMKMANGTNSIKTSAGYPGTRAKSASMVRELYLKAQEYQKKMEKAGTDSSKRPPRDLQLEPLVEVLNGKRVVHFHTHQANDILTAIRLQKEFGFRAVLHHVTEGWRVAKEIAAAGIPCSIISIDIPGGKKEAMNLTLRNGAVLDSAGVLVAFHTDDGIIDSRLFLRSAAMMVRGGMRSDKALEALTIAGARMLDLSSRVGSLEKGKDADFIILSDAPFLLHTIVEQTWVEGVKRFDISRPQDRALLLGGYDVYSPIRAENHHHDNEADNENQ